MQRKLNVRFLLWVAGSLLIAAVCVHFLHAFQARRNAAALLRQAERLVDEGKLEKASFYFSHYLQFEPDDAAALVKYALVIDTLATHGPSRTHAALVLDQAFRRSPANSEIGLRLVHQQVAIGRYSEAISNLEKLRSANLAKGEIEHLLGWAYEARGAFGAHGNEARTDFNRSVDWLTKAVEAAPQQVESYLFLVHVFANRLNNTEEAGRVLDRLVEANQESHHGYLARARFHKEAHRHEAAEKDLDQALRLAPKEAEVLLLAAQWDLDKDDFTKARTHLEQGLTLYPQAPALYYTLAKVELKTRNRNEAISVLRRGLTKAPTSADLIGLLADSLFEAGATAEAEKQIAELRKVHPESGLADYLQARLLGGQCKWSDAAELCEKALSRLHPAAEWTARTFLLLGNCYEQTGDPEHQLAAYQRAVVQDPGSAPARLGVARGYLALGRLEEAITELGTLAKSRTPPAETSLLLARVHMLRTLQLADAQRDWAKVDALLNQAKELNANEANIAILRAEVLSAKKRLQEADELLEKAIATDGSRVALWCARADLALRRGQAEQAKKILEEAQSVVGDGPELRLAWSRWAIKQGPAEARRALAALSSKLAFSADEQVGLLRKFAALWQQLGDSGMARKLLQEAADKQPRDARLRFQLFELAIQRADETEARQLLADIKRLEGEAGALWRYVEAALLFADAKKGDKGALAKSRERLDEVRTKQKTWSRVPLLEARIDEWEGKRQSALEKYREAFQLGEREPRTTHRLVRLLLDAGRFVEAEETVRTIDEQIGLDAGLIRLGVQAALANQKPARAVQLARRVVDPSSQDYRDLLWLGDLLMTAGEKVQAETVFRRALELGSHTPETWVALVDCLARSEKWSEAEAVCRQAEAQLPPDRRTLALARCFVALGRHDRAEEFFSAALKENSKDAALLSEIAEFFMRTDQPGKAESSLRHLNDMATSLSPEQAATTRRRLAMVLAERGDSSAALALLARNSKGPEEEVADKRVRAFITSLKSGQGKAALLLFDQTLLQQPLHLQEQLVHARLCTAAGEHWRSREILLGLANRWPENPQVLAACVRSFLAGGQTSDAAGYLTKLQRREPQSLRTQTLSVEVSKVRGS